MFPKYTRDDLAVLLGCTTTHTTEDYVLAPDGLWLRVDWHAWQGLTDQERSAIAGSNWPMPQQNAQGKPAVADDGTVLIGRFGCEPLLGFPVTALKLWEFDRETGGTFSDYLPQDADEWMAERLAEGGPGNEAVVRLARVLLSDEPPQDEAQARSAEKEADWMDHVLDAAGFFALAHVPPVHAAMLLCRLCPHDETEQDAERISTEETTPDDFKRLRLTFLDKDRASPGNRTLLDWLAIAEQAGRRTHSWARRYGQVRGLADQAVRAPSESPSPKPARQTPQQRKEARQAQRWQECIDAGLTMPTDTYAAYPPGIKAVAERLGITRQSLAEDLDAYRERIFSRQQ